MRSVLLVDDDMSIVSGLQQLLATEEIPTAVANDAESAEAMITANFYPVVLADLRLRSEFDGLRLIETIRRISPGSKIAAMTGYATPEIESHLMSIGASTLLRKPFDTDLFLTTVRTLRVDDYDAIYRITAPRLRSMMRRRYSMDHSQSEDVLQQAWCLLLEKRAEVRDVGAWLSGTVVNLCRQTIDRCVRERPFDAFPSSERSYIDDSSMTLAVRRALSQLDKRSRTLCELIGLEQLSYADVSSRMNIPIGSIGPLYIRAKQRLKQQLAN